MPYNFGKLANKKKGPLITINYKRVIETWFDDKYKEYFYTREPLARYLDMGDISEQVRLKEKLQCKSFQWYMDNVAYDVFDKFPPLPANLHWGELRSVATEMCKWMQIRCLLGWFVFKRFLHFYSAQAISSAECSNKSEKDKILTKKMVRKYQFSSAKPAKKIFDFGHGFKFEWP